MRVLLTGATGFVGAELARELLFARGLTRLTLVIRPLAGETGRQRFERLVAQWRKFVETPDATALAKVDVVEADLALPGVLPVVDGPYDYMIHSAATTELGVPLAEGRRTNVVATQRALQMARRARVGRFVHYSTAYVCGRRRALIGVQDAAPGAYHNHYERTKRESEDAVRSGGVPYTILRPSIIVGRGDDGYVSRTKVLYSVWRMWLSGFIPRAPIDPKAWVDLVPVDFVVDATLGLMQLPETLGGTYHLCAGEHRQSPKTIMLTATRAFAVPVPPLSPPWIAYVLRRWPARLFLTHALREILDAMYWHLPYLGIRGRLFDMSQTLPLLAKVGVPPSNFAEYGERLFQFCRDTAWGKRPRKELRCSA